MTLRQILAHSQALVGLATDLRTVARRLSRISGRDRRRIRHYLATHTNTKLQIGSGHNLLPGWLCTDIAPTNASILYLDAARPYPIASHTFDYIFCEHLIEHLSWQDGQRMLRECRRVLKPGGSIRIATPDLAVLTALYNAGSAMSPTAQAYVDWVMNRFLADMPSSHSGFIINYAFYSWGHQFLYDHELLELALREAGFTHVRRFTCGESDDPNLRGLESHGECLGAVEAIDFETMVLEGR